jgi:peroxiredoxin
MKKQTVFFAYLALFLMCAAGYMIYKIVEIKTENEVIKITRQTLPKFNFYNLDSIATNNSFIKKDRPVVIFYYNADCEFCQFEAVEINKNILLFKDAQIIMVSFNSLKDINAFAIQYGLIYPNITLLQDPKYEFTRWFGKASIPSIFIYNAQHQFIKEYHGETKIEAILKHL